MIWYTIDLALCVLPTDLVRCVLQIFDPSIAKLRCAYPKDGQVSGKKTGCECGKVCPAASLAESLSQAAAAHSNYNMMIVEADSITAHLPHSILAFWYDTKPAKDHQGGFCEAGGHPGWTAEQVVRNVRQGFQQKFGLGASDVPLVALHFPGQGGFASLADD